MWTWSREAKQQTHSEFKQTFKKKKKRRKAKTAREVSCECDLCRLSSVETGKHLFSQQLSFKERDAVLFRCHQGSRGTLRSLQSESYAAVKGGRGWSGFTRSDDVEVKIRNKTMMLIMQKQQSGGIKQPITEPPRLPVSQKHADVVAASTANRQT